MSSLAENRPRRSATAMQTAEAATLLILLVMLCLTSVYRNMLWVDEPTIWSDAMDKSPGKVRPVNEISRRYMREARYDLALELLLLAEDLNPAYSPVHSNKGHIFYKLGQWDAAEREFKLAIKYGPSYEDLHRFLGYVYLRKGRTESALEEFSKGMKLLSDYPGRTGALVRDYNNEAFKFTDALDFKNAALLHGIAAKLEPDYANAHYGLALAYEGLGDNAGAIRHWRRYLRIAAGQGGSEEWRKLAAEHLQRLSGGG